MGSLDANIFGKKKFSDILQEIYNNQKKKEAQISALIGELKPLITDIGDATLIVPLIKEYMELGLKNDEQELQDQVKVKVENAYKKVSAMKWEGIAKRFKVLIDKLAK